MAPVNTIFEKLDLSLSQQGALAAANTLVEELRSAKKHRELFEAIKMKHRLSLGLTAVGLEGDPPLTEQQQDVLERGLIEACREVGVALLANGQFEEGWMYMRPVGDREAAAKAIEQVPVTPDNLDVIIQLLVHEGVDIARGTRLSLEQRGTCNTITMLESVVAMRGRADQQKGVSELVRHVHAELLASVRADFERRQGKPPVGDSISEVLASIPGWLKDGSYHLDTSHLASTVRFARVLDDREFLALAHDLSEYGRQLHPQYQYPGDEPFGDLYASSSAFFAVLLGKQVEFGLRLFLQKAESLDPQEHGTIAIETYADLLARVNRPADAIAFLIKRMPQGMRPCGVAPSLLELSQQANDFSLMLDQAKTRGDAVGYAAAILQRASIGGGAEKS